MSSSSSGSSGGDGGSSSGGDTSSTAASDSVATATIGSDASAAPTTVGEASPASISESDIAAYVPSTETASIGWGETQQAQSPLDGAPRIGGDDLVSVEGPHSTELARLDDETSAPTDTLDPDIELYKNRPLRSDGNNEVRPIPAQEAASQATIETYGPMRANQLETFRDWEAWLKDFSKQQIQSGGMRAGSGEYTTSPRPGKAGELRVSRDVDASTLLQELTHARFDYELGRDLEMARGVPLEQAKGFPGPKLYDEHPEVLVLQEELGWGSEIALARHAGHEDIVPLLEAGRDEEIQHIIEDIPTITPEKIATARQQFQGAITRTTAEVDKRVAAFPTS